MIEMLLVIGLSGVIMVSAMALLLSFANIHASSHVFNSKVERDIFAKKLVGMLIFQYESSEPCRDVCQNQLNFGIFWQSDCVPIFAGEAQEKRISVGLVKDSDKLKFVWGLGEGVDSGNLVLFEGVEKICIMAYDLECNSWVEHEFSDATVRNALEDCEGCCLRILRRGGEIIVIPLIESY
jgi:hypothetical protein